MSLKHNCIKCFHSLGVPSRMKIFNHLQKNGKSSVSDVVKRVGLTQPTISYHLKEMQDSGLLASKKVGKEVLYEIYPACSDCILKHA